MRTRFPAVVVALVLGSACGGSLLVKRGDATFERATGQLAQTERALADAGVSDGERLLFLQAEAMYRYRFEPPRRSPGTVLASVAAVAIELPALQAVAGSFDLFQLRLRAADGAIQLWETLLERYPDSPLKPWALYRLGWAYRYAITDGFPHDTPEDVFDLVPPDSAWGALAAEAKQVRWKSADVATALSIVPGGGQLYAGEVGNGLLRLFVAVAAAAAVLVPTGIAWRRREELSWRTDWPLLLSGFLGATVLTIDYSLAYDDALRAVMQFNERAEAEFEAAH